MEQPWVEERRIAWGQLKAGNHHPPQGVGIALAGRQKMGLSQEGPGVALKGEGDGITPSGSPVSGQTCFPSEIRTAIDIDQRSGHIGCPIR